MTFGPQDKAGLSRAGARGPDSQLEALGAGSHCLSWLETEAGSREGGAVIMCLGDTLLADCFPHASPAL